MPNILQLQINEVLNYNASVIIYDNLLVINLIYCFYSKRDDDLLGF